MLLRCYELYYIYCIYIKFKIFYYKPFHKMRYKPYVFPECICEASALNYNTVHSLNHAVNTFLKGKQKLSVFVFASSNANKLLVPPPFQKRKSLWNMWFSYSISNKQNMCKHYQLKLLYCVDVAHLHKAYCQFNFSSILHTYVKQHLLDMKTIHYYYKTTRSHVLGQKCFTFEILYYYIPGIKLCTVTRPFKEFSNGAHWYRE